MAEPLASRDFAAVRAEFALPETFARKAQAEAEDAAKAANLKEGRVDATDIPFVTIDPPGAKDLDQAMFVERTAEGGFRVHYAIADLGAFVVPNGAVDAEARTRGQTIYLPDGNVPLHPPALSEGAASLLPGEVRPAALWTIDTDSDGNPTSANVRRAMVRSVQRFDYTTVQADLDRGAPHPSVAALPDLGRARRELAVARGAIELQLPEQEISPVPGEVGWQLTIRMRTRVDAWNAEVSLLTGMCAAQMMLDARIGVLRTLPEADPDALGWLRKSARNLGIEWPEDLSVAELLAGLDPSKPESLALFTDSTRLLRGAGYRAFDGELPPESGHAGIGGPYSHVTAPIRRLVDRFATEICLAVSADQEIPEWARAGLAELPAHMDRTDSVAAKVERACLDQVETWVLADRVGQRFEAIVLSADGGKADIMLTDPPVLAKCTGEGLTEGERVGVRLVEVDPVRRTTTFEV